ncbi:hypothetical protein [Haloterrigena alkaliphila]|uniref:Uncharacterized protein n=1 Tax=Haloterrigena alkaliphila TaxID=2816475 RepID=A0A8A2VJJ6_9EURY|nr:hypothetical protein [Haloterrigena alkaliphila]QSX00503.1 hypothetical protein J0X25_05970 [Haloterrigena alkaliphila]
MVLKKLLGSKATRSLTVVSILSDAKQAFASGNRTRGLLLVVVAVLAWKWAMLGMVAQGVLKLFRGGSSASSPA